MLTLNASDQQALSDAVDVLLRPLDFPNDVAWRRSVNRKLRTLMRADVASFVLPIDGKAEAYCEQVGDRVRPYREHMLTEKPLRALQRRVRAFGVSDRKAAWGPRYQELVQTRYYEEFVRPLQLFDSLTICTSVGAEPGIDGTAQLLFNQDSPHREPFGSREIAIGRLILPALKSGVMTWLRLKDQGHAFAIQIDDVDTALALFTLGGDVLHLNSAMKAIVQQDPDGTEILDLARVMARRQQPKRSNPKVHEISGNADVQQTLRTRQHRYTLRLTRIRSLHADGDESVLLLVQPAERRLPGVNELRARFLLTPRQAQVALLLAERKTNAEIAEALCVSAHTARHHTEAVMAKLEVQDRREVWQRVVE